MLYSANGLRFKTVQKTMMVEDKNICDELRMTKFYNYINYYLNLGDHCGNSVVRQDRSHAFTPPVEHNISYV